MSSSKKQFAAINKAIETHKGISFKGKTISSSRKNSDAIRQQTYFNLASLMLEKVAYLQHDPKELAVFQEKLDQHPEVIEMMGNIKAARENPKVTKQLAKDYRVSAKKTSSSLKNDDLFTMMLANAVFAQDNSQYLSPEVTQIMQDESSHFKGFDGGSFGGSGSSGEWSQPTPEVHQHFQQNDHYTQTDTTVYESPSSTTYDSPNFGD